MAMDGPRCTPLRRVESLVEIVGLSERQMRKKKPKSLNVVFRLLEDEFEALRTLGVRFDESPGQCARRIVREVMKNTRDRKLYRRIKSLEKRLESVTQKVELVIEMVEASTSVLLTHAGKLSSTDAKEWVATSFH